MAIDFFKKKCVSQQQYMYVYIYKNGQRNIFDEKRSGVAQLEDVTPFYLETLTILR
jgi:hypothetical protein